MPVAPFRAELQWPERGIGLVAVAGEIDMHTAQQLGDTLAVAREGEPRRLIVDLSAVGFIDSIGLSVLVQSARLLQAAGACFCLTGAGDRLMRVFEIAGLDDVLSFYPTREQALER